MKKPDLSFHKTIYMFSGTLKGLFFILVVICILVIIIYIQSLINDLRAQTREWIELRVQEIQQLASDEQAGDNLTWGLENIIQKTKLPLIVTDQRGNPAAWSNIGVARDDWSPEAINEVQRLLKKMQNNNRRFPITYKGQVVNYLYYGDSKLTTQLRYLPFITIFGLGLLIFAAFMGFSSIKHSEQRYVWVGMAKETAHQLGTPLSSLMGWLEIIKLHPDDPSRIKQMAEDMTIDVNRLEQVAARFSKIGSKAELAIQEIHPVLQEVIAYFQKRLPQKSKDIQLIADLKPVKRVALNRDLFEWAVENLIKNALDAVKRRNGKVIIRTGMLEDENKIYIDIEDTGVGIHVQNRRNVFKPGYSTKKRGWGLGLNVTKRIVEDLHKGRVFIKETHMDKGTTMRIVL